MFKSLRRLFDGTSRPIANAPAKPRRRVRQTAPGFNGRSRLELGADRIAAIVAPQLDAASCTRPEQWHSQRPFVYGYIDALADMHAINSGKDAQGDDSRELAAGVLRRLMGDAMNDRVAWVFQIWARQRRADFIEGRSAAIDDYAHWSERPMSGIALRLAQNPAPAEVLPGEEEQTL